MLLSLIGPSIQNFDARFNEGIKLVALLEHIWLVALLQAAVELVSVILFLHLPKLFGCEQLTLEGPRLDSFLLQELLLG